MRTRRPIAAPGSAAPPGRRRDAAAAAPDGATLPPAPPQAGRCAGTAARRRAGSAAQPDPGLPAARPQPLLPAPPGPLLPAPPPLLPTPAAALLPAPPAWARAGLDALSAAHPELARIERTVGPLPWRSRPPGFPGLLRAICGQMISDRAAAVIFARLAALPGALEPAGLLQLDDAALCGVAGLSRPKAAHARALATAALDGRLPLDALPDMTDAEALAALCAVRGLGRWTAQVHLLFAEGRPDLFPEGDLALAAALAHLRELPARPTPRVLAAEAENWRPFRSLAARLLWHWWRHATGRAAMDPTADA
ncbi:DNA-3-methyladenine glycosylase family protein [Roseomonas sp. BN140053]|uniref:DNA-3-methyladenine glycosylase family protein n=1 Tax=Roseomonas sp. BN140053 TaxID=3391898 RepID=UPI0039EC0960